MRTRSALLLLALLAAAASSSAQVEVTIGLNPDRHQGTHPSGRLLLFTPDPLLPGSSVSHWDTSATPNLLMEPSINPDLGFLDLDLTPLQMEDIGWEMGTSSFVITNLDPDGVGFTDPTPFPGAPGNPATTLGEARINLFNAVLGTWANTLESDVPIDILVTWVPLECSPTTGAVLAGASTIFVFSDDTFPKAGTWYPSALAEALAGEELSPDPEDDGGDIIVFVNSSIDEGCLGEGTGYYYGLDGNEATTQVDLAPVVLHEAGHGLGFANFTDESTGAFLQGMPSIFDDFTLDMTTGQTWAEMATDAERVASAVNYRKVVWDSLGVTAAANALLATGMPELAVSAPAEVAGTYEIGLASFGPPIGEVPIRGELACLEDGLADDSFTNGCSAATNPEELQGKIALIDRGTCFFTDKVKNAQDAGAIAVVIGNNQGNLPVSLGGVDDGSITIPSVGVGQSDAARLRRAACPGEAVVQGGRFEIQARWRSADQEGQAQPVELTDDSVYFYFFNPQNVEMVVKVLDACPSSGHFWVFAGGLTNVEVELTVTDRASGQTKTWMNPLGTPFMPIQDTRAFATCP